MSQHEAVYIITVSSRLHGWIVLQTKFEKLIVTFELSYNTSDQFIGHVRIVVRYKIG